MKLGRTLLVLGLGAHLAGTACSKKDETGKAASVPPLDPSAQSAAPTPPPPVPAPAAPVAPAGPAAEPDPKATITGNEYKARHILVKTKEEATAIIKRQRAKTEELLKEYGVERRQPGARIQHKL